MLRARLSMAEGLEVIISDVFIPPGATVPRHYHPGEEFVYALEGSVLHVEEGKPDRMVYAGEAFVIPPGAKHAPRGGPEGGRAIVFRVHVEGQDERILVDE
jgi:quercetin dioxygenase-like cupin family protein